MSSKQDLQEYMNNLTGDIDYNEKSKWIKEYYSGHIDNEIFNTNTTYNTTINWALTLTPIFLAGIFQLYSIGQNLGNSVNAFFRFPGIASWIFLSVGYIVINHLYIRATKAYLNRNRFNVIRKAINKVYILKPGNVSDEDIKIILKYIYLYDEKWTSPFTKTGLGFKVFKDGFIYIYSILIAVTVFMIVTSKNEYINMTALFFIVLITIAILIGSLVWFFFISKYCKVVEPIEEESLGKF